MKTSTTLEFLAEKNKSLTEQQLTDVAQRLSFSMQSAKEYYQSAASVTLLTKPLLIFYGMVALSKALFIATYLKKSPSTGHGLESPKDDFENNFSNISTKIKKDGTFPQFHCCHSKQSLCVMNFTLNELLSVAPDVKIEYETVFRKKSNAIEIQKIDYGHRLIDNDGFEKYEKIAERLSKMKIGSAHYFNIQYTGKVITVFNFPCNIPKIRCLSGKEFLILPFNKQNGELNLPEMSSHYLIMYLLGMASRYYPKEWGEITEGKASGDIYVIKKFLEVTERKFPNLILNILRNKEFLFVSPKLEEVQGLSNNELERVWKFVEGKENDKWRHAGLSQ